MSNVSEYNNSLLTNWFQYMNYVRNFNELYVEK